MRMIGQSERAAGHHGAYIAFASGPRSGGALFFHAHTGYGVAFSGLHVVARPFIDFVVGMGGLPRLAAHGRQIGQRFGEIKIIGDPGPGGQVFGNVETGKVFLVHLAGVGVEGQDLVGGTGERLVRARMIAENQAMLAVRMVEKPVDAPFLHQPLGKVEIAFPVLYLVLAGRVTARKAFFHREAVFPEHLVQNLGNAFVLEDFIVRGPGGQPQPRTQRQRVEHAPSLGTHHARSGNDAADFPHARADAARRPGTFAFQGDCHCAFLPHKRFEIHIGGQPRHKIESIRRFELHGITGKPAQRFLTGKSDKGQSRNALNYGNSRTTDGNRTGHGGTSRIHKNIYKLFYILSYSIA